MRDWINYEGSEGTRDMVMLLCGIWNDFFREPWSDKNQKATRNELVDELNKCRKNIPFWNSGVLNSLGTVADSLFSVVFFIFHDFLCVLIYLIDHVYISLTFDVWHVFFVFFGIQYLGFGLTYSVKHFVSISYLIHELKIYGISGPKSLVFGCRVDPLHQPYFQGVLLLLPRSKRGKV